MSLTRRMERIESRGSLWQCLSERSCCIYWKSRVSQSLDAHIHLLLSLRQIPPSWQQAGPLHPDTISYHTCNTLLIHIRLPCPPSNFCCQGSDSRVALFIAKAKFMLPKYRHPTNAITISWTPHLLNTI